MTTMLVVLCCAFSALGSFLFGYDSSIISSSIAQEEFKQRFEHDLTDSSIGGIVSSFTGGAILGSVFASCLSDIYGRRIALFIGGILAASGAAFQGGATAVGMLIVGRFTAGVAIGIMSATVPVYCSEVAPFQTRGFLAGMQQWMIGLGFVVAQWVGYGCSLLPGILSWRLPLSLQVAPAIVLAAGALFLPESPRWLIEHNKPDNGRQVLCRLRGTHAHLNQKSIDQEFCEIQKAISQERLSSAKSWAEFFRCPAKRRRVFLGAGIQALTQCSGINVIAYYGPRIYAGLGFSTSQSLMIIGISGALAWTWNTLCLFILDHVGRRKLLIPSFIGMGATLCVEVALFQAFDPRTSQNDNALRAQVAMYFVFTLCFTSLGVISWIYPSEIFPTAIRARGTSVATVVNWSLNLVFAQCSPIALSRLGYKYFYFFVTFNWAGAILVWAFFPETLGKTLEELDGVFEPKLKNNTPSSSGYASAEKPSIETRSESKTIEPA